MTQIIYFMLNMFFLHLFKIKASYLASSILLNFFGVFIGYVTRVNGKWRKDEKRGTWKVGNLTYALVEMHFSLMYSGKDK